VTCIVALCLAGAMWVALPSGSDRRCRAVSRREVEVPAVPASVPAAGARKSHGAAALDLISAALDAGLPHLPAVAAVAAALPGPTGAPLRRAAAMVDVTGESAWRALVKDPEVGPLAAVMARSEQSGAPVAESVRILAEEVRREERAERMSRARRVGVRTAAPLGLCFLPAFFVVAVVPTVIGLIGDVL
jgi:Flp pilus assembly protein TadB